MRNIDFGAESIVVDVRTESVCYRCRECRRRYAVTWSQPLLADKSHVEYSMSYQVLAFHAWCEGRSLTTIARDLNACEQQVSQWLEEACAITENDMLAMREAMVFGQRSRDDGRGGG